jgi:hypothetical protein
VKNLNNIKVGDELIRNISNYGSINKQIVTVDRVTPTQIIIGNTRYRKDNGRALGYGDIRSTPPWLTIPIDEDLDEIRIGNKISFVLNAMEYLSSTTGGRNKIKGLNEEQIVDIITLLSQYYQDPNK